MNIKQIPPVGRLAGSKYRLLDQLERYLAPLSAHMTLIDMFGGSLTVAVNLKAKYGMRVWVNDYDHIAGKKWREIVQNQIVFDGVGKTPTQAGIRQGRSKIRNGFIIRYRRWQRVVKTLNIVNFDFEMWIKSRLFNQLKPNDLIYIDPPYLGIQAGYPGLTIRQHGRLASGAKRMRKRCRVVLSYNNSPLVKSFYFDWKVAELNKTNNFGQARQKARVKELVIWN